MDTFSDTLLSEDSRRKERVTNFQFEVNMIETVGEMNRVEETKAKPKVVLNLTQE